MIVEDSLQLRSGALQNARVLVTGGGTGLGRMIAEGCAALGATVYICGRRGGLLDATAAAINETHGAGSARPIPCDLRSAPSIDGMLETIWEDGGALTGLINNASANFIARTETISPNGFDAINQTIARGTFLVTTGCGKRWIKEGVRGAILSVLTTWVINGGPYGVPAAMAKAGVWAMTQSLAVEWGRHGIRLNALSPGAFPPTEGMAARLMPAEQGMDEQNTNPMRRNGTPEELANLATFLISPGAAFISGQMIAIDGAGYQGTGANFAGLANWTDAMWDDVRERIRRVDAEDKARRTTPAAN